MTSALNGPQVCTACLRPPARRSIRFIHRSRARLLLPNTPPLCLLPLHSLSDCLRSSPLPAPRGHSAETGLPPIGGWAESLCPVGTHIQPLVALKPAGGLGRWQENVELAQPRLSPPQTPLPPPAPWPEAPRALSRCTPSGRSLGGSVPHLPSVSLGRSELVSLHRLLVEVPVWEHPTPAPRPAHLCPHGLGGRARSWERHISQRSMRSNHQLETRALL